MKMEHTFFMQKALQEAQKAYICNEIPIGTVIVAENKIIARAHNQVEMLHDATAHAEMIALTSAMQYLHNKYLIACTLYTTLFPCIMCFGAILCAKIKNIVVGAANPCTGHVIEQMLTTEKNIVIKRNILKHECSALINNFFKKKRIKKNKHNFST